MKKMWSKVFYIFILLLFIVLSSACKKNDVLTISVHNLDNRTFELRKEVSFEDAYITIIYGDGHTEDIPLTGEYIDSSELYNAFSSVGEKKLTVFYKDNNGKTHYYEALINIVENQSLSSYITELENYKSDVIYNENVKKQIDSIKMVYSIMIKNSNNVDANKLLELAKQEIDTFKTKVEEDNLISLEDLTKEIEKIKKDLNVLINYEDSNIKNEINALNDKLNQLKADLNNEELESEITSIKLSLSILEASVTNIKNNVDKNNKLILSLTETINNYLSSFVTKEELETKIEDIKISYQNAIESAINEQQMIVELRVNDGYIEYRYNNSNVFEKLLDVSSFVGDEIDDLSVNEKGLIRIRFKSGNVIETNSSYLNDFDSVVLNQLNTEKEAIINIIKDYIKLNYNPDFYDYNSVKDLLGDYYNGYVEYVHYTNYAELSNVKILLNEIQKYLDNQFELNSDSFTEIQKLEQKLKEIDTNKNVCKAYFATLLSTQEIDEYLKEAYVNRILCCESIKSAVELYELALS